MKKRKQTKKENKDKNDPDDAKALKSGLEIMIRANISEIKPSFDKKSLTFTKLELNGNKLGKKLDTLGGGLSNYTGLRTINLSHNNHADISTLATFPNLINLNLTDNKLTSMKVFNKEIPEGAEDESAYWPMIQDLKLQNNKIKEIGKLNLPNLRRLDLSNNVIDKISEEFEGLEKLEYLDLGINSISSLENLKNMPELKELYLKNNKIHKFTGLANCSSLTILSLRGNNISGFEEELPALENLSYLNMRGTMLGLIEEIDKLQVFTSLKTLIISFTPFIDKNKETYVFQILEKFPTLKTLNKMNVTRNMKEQTISYIKRIRAEQRRKEMEEAVEQEE